MSVDYNAILYVGKCFNDSSEALEFIEEYLELTEEDLLEIKEDGLHEWMYGHDVLSFELLNYYVSESYCVLGIDITHHVRSPSTFNDKVEIAVVQWKNYFGEEPYDIICDVCVS